MPNLSEHRIKAGYGQAKDAINELRKAIPYIDKSLMSRFEVGKILPIKEDAEAIAALYGVETRDIWSAEEADILNLKEIPFNYCSSEECEIEELSTTTFGYSVVSKPDAHKLKHKACFRLTDEAMETITTSILQACGYPSKTAWFYACVKRLQAEYNARSRGKVT